MRTRMKSLGAFAASLALLSWAASCGAGDGQAAADRNVTAVGEAPES